jgi:hypothetical protein
MYIIQADQLDPPRLAAAGGVEAVEAVEGREGGEGEEEAGVAGKNARPTWRLSMLMCRRMTMYTTSTAQGGHASTCR